MIEDWLNTIDISAKELAIFSQPGGFSQNNSKSSSNVDFHDLFEKFQLTSNQVFSFAPCATDIIDSLFKQYVDDDTLVITTNSEHPSVVENLNNCKNVLRLIKSTTCQCKTTTNELSKYKRVFVYMIALSSGDSCFVPNSVFNLLQKQLAGIPSVFVLDAVQELFTLPRDYSIFDYVIGTAHAIIPEYNCGIVISKEQPYCSQTENIELYQMLSRVKQLSKQLSAFRYMMYQEFGYELATDNSLLVTPSPSQYMFNLEDNKNRLQGINDGFVSRDQKAFAPATFRAFPALFQREKFLKNITKTHYRLKF